jgi:hypothetical protein
MKNRVLQILFLALVFCLPNCTKDRAIVAEAPVAPEVPAVPPNQNLILNASFENNGQPTIKNWITNSWPNDSSLASIAQDAPAGGGQWSIKLLDYNSQGIMLAGKADYYITGFSDTNTFILKAWVRSSNPGPIYAPGSIQMGILKNNQLIHTQKIDAEKSLIWMQYALTYTADTRQNDTIVIRLQGGGSAPAVYSYSFFDLIELKKSL